MTKLIDEVREAHSKNKEERMKELLSVKSKVISQIRSNLKVKVWYYKNINSQLSTSDIINYLCLDSDLEGFKVDQSRSPQTNDTIVISCDIYE